MTTSQSDATTAAAPFDTTDFLRRISMDRASPYDLWTQSIGIPIHEGYFAEDVRTIDLGWWEERQCYAAFLKLVGQEGVTEARVTEIPPGKTLPPMKFALDEVVYVIEGNGLTTVSIENKDPKKTFEWTKHSLFMIPRNITFEMTNAQGTRPVRLLHYNSLPVSMRILPDPSAYFNGNNLPMVENVVSSEGGGLYGAAQAVQQPNRPDGTPGMGYWIGNFFPDMKAWDKLAAFRGRGAGGHVVWIRYPGAMMVNHMSVFPSRTYKKAHRHGPGVVIIIPDGEGFSVMWPEGGEKVVIPWHEGSVFVPPDRWFHQHFNVGGEPARYLAFHGPQLSNRGYAERVQRASDQIEYPEEEAWIREKFEGELATRGLTTLMPDEAYKDATYEWAYKEGE